MNKVNKSWVKTPTLLVFSFVVFFLVGCSGDKVSSENTTIEKAPEKAPPKELERKKSEHDTGASHLGNSGGIFWTFKTPLANIHSYTAPKDGQSANAHIIETDKALVLIDVPVFRSYAEQLKLITDSLNKPIDRIYLTSPVIDHWGGLDVFSGVKVYTDEAVSNQLAGIAEAMPKRYSELLLTTSPVTMPLKVHSGIVDGLTYEFELIKNGDKSPRLLIKLPEVEVIFAQDLVSSNAHSYLAGADLQAWVKNLAALAVSAKESEIYAGHGMPARVNAEQIGRQIHYIQSYKKHSEEADISDAELAKRMIKEYPDFDARDLLYWRL